MKKLSISLLVMLLIASLFTSCSMGSDDASDVRVKVRLTPSGGGRSLNTDIETINLDDDSITWHYSATKESETKFNYGATSDSILPKDGIVTLSQGDWTISLRGIKDGKKVYDGTTSKVTIKWNFYEPNVTVPVPVKQNTGDNGFIVINNVTIPNGNSNVAPNYISIDDETEIIKFQEPYLRLECTPGTHTITFAYKEENVIASKSLVVTVISGRETAISGKIDKNETSTGITAPTSETKPIEVKQNEATTVSVSVAPANTSSISNQTTVTFPQGSLPEEATTAVLNLSVKSADSSDFSVASTNTAAVAGIDISLKVNNQEVTSFNNEYVVITTYIIAGLESVQVKYTGEGDQPTLVSYNRGTGELVFKTNHFSEYYVLADCEAVNTTINVGYSSFANAIDNASDGDTILLKKDIMLEKNDITPDGTVKITKGIDINLNGYNITGDNVRALHFAAGISNITGKGTIKVVGKDIVEGSSVIRIGDGSTWSNPKDNNVKLTIGEDVTVETDVCYAVSVFGSDTKENLVVKGKLSGRNGLGTSGNENDAKYSPIISLTQTAEIKASEGYALYLPAAGSYEINGKIEGPGAICTKAGNLTVAIGDGAIITATKTAGIEHEGGYSNGPATKNYAVVVENNSAYGGPAKVVINGGKITGSIGVYDDKLNPPAEQQKGTIVVTGGYFTDLDSAINYATDGATIKLAADVTGKGIGSKDAGKAVYRESLIIDFNNHTYTMNDPAVGSTGTESQAMHWGASLGAVTLKNGTFKVDDNASEVGMAMQNYIDFTAENMTFDFTNIPVDFYGDWSGTEYEAFSYLEIPMFNNNSGKMVLKDSTIIMPNDSTKGISADGNGVDIIDCTIDGAINLQDLNSVVRIKNSIVKKEIVSYFNNDSYKIVSTTDNEGYDVYRLVCTTTEEQYSFIKQVIVAMFHAEYSDEVTGVESSSEGEKFKYTVYNTNSFELDGVTYELHGKLIQVDSNTVIIDLWKDTKIGDSNYSILVEAGFDDERQTEFYYANIQKISTSQNN